MYMFIKNNAMDTGNTSPNFKTLNKDSLTQTWTTKLLFETYKFKKKVLQYMAIIYSEHKRSE